MSDDIVCKLMKSAGFSSEGLDEDSILFGPLNFEVTKCDVETFMHNLRELNPEEKFSDDEFNPVDATLLGGFVTVPIESSEILDTTFWLLKAEDEHKQRYGELVAYNQVTDKMRWLIPIPKSICRVAIIMHDMEDDLAKLSEEV